MGLRVADFDACPKHQNYLAHTPNERLWDTMHYKNISALKSDIVYNIWKIPSDVDLIVGIPRSGILAASMIALAKNLPLVDLEGFIEGNHFKSGKTRFTGDQNPEFKHALIVDDSARTGEAMRSATAELKDATRKLPKYTTCVVYGMPSGNPNVDIVLETLSSPRIFEWNVMQHPGILANACLDIDGVLCHDPTPEQNDDGEKYRNFLLTAKPIYLPTHEIHSLVTSRLEKYRPETEIWLKQWGVRYQNLIMLDLKSAEERRRLGSHAIHKALHYKKSHATLFIESEYIQAQEIARLSGKDVLSIENSSICSPGALSISKGVQVLRNPRLISRRVRGIFGDRVADQLKRVYFLFRGTKGN